MNCVISTTVIALALSVPHMHAVAEPIATLPSPRVNSDSWVIIEVWPEVRSITLSAFFLDSSYEKNRNLCEAAKRVFDREQEARAKEADREFSSYRLCLSVVDARAQGYFRTT